jgi:Fe-S cluster biogenesis protein NfuA
MGELSLKLEEPSGDLKRRLDSALECIRPYLKADGGDVHIVGMREGAILVLQWEGTCVICPLSQMTLRAGVERVVMKECPEIQRVEAKV